MILASTGRWRSSRSAAKYATQQTANRSPVRTDDELLAATAPIYDGL